jgi:hypothetical protein
LGPDIQAENAALRQRLQAVEDAAAEALGELEDVQVGPLPLTAVAMSAVLAPASEAARHTKASSRHYSGAGALINWTSKLVYPHCMDTCATSVVPASITSVA